MADDVRVECISTWLANGAASVTAVRSRGLRGWCCWQWRRRGEHSEGRVDPDLDGYRTKTREARKRRCARRLQWEAGRATLSGVRSLA